MLRSQRTSCVGGSQGDVQYRAQYSNLQSDVSSFVKKKTPLYIFRVTLGWMGSLEMAPNSGLDFDARKNEVNHDSLDRMQLNYGAQKKPREAWSISPRCLEYS